ncbi:hypothetical protein [Schlesneria sp. T3-172]|uniref:hypothetical protein n=1 Tax=Schlesneria sphaerica TaxID=3373610 RepID=UPI0037CA2472
MLSEFSFTPSVFSAESHADAHRWQEQLCEMARELFPRNNPCRIVISNLCEGHWYHEAQNWAKNKANKDHPARNLVQGFLQELESLLVARPSSPGSPTDDASWVMEALTSNSVESIDRIIACKPIFERFRRVSPAIRNLDEVSDNGFWRGVSSQTKLPMRIDKQILVLRKLTLHSEFLWLVTPYILGGEGNDTDFAVAFVEAAFVRPEGFPQPKEVVLHTKAPEKLETIDNLVSNIRKRVAPILKPKQKVELIMWSDRLLDRYVVGGNCTASSRGHRQLSPRWGVLMSHIARNVKANGMEKTTPWCLLDRTLMGDVFREFDIDSLKAKPRTFMIEAGA